MKRSSGFTLIEVLAAFVIFAGGVLMVLGLTGTLSTQMRWAGAQSEIVILAQQRLDSLETLPFSSLATGTVSETVTIQGDSYTLQTQITMVTAILLQLDISVSPGSGVTGPSYATTSYAADNW